MKINLTKYRHLTSVMLCFALVHMSSNASTIALSDWVLLAFAIFSVLWFRIRKMKIDKFFFLFTLFYIGLSFLYVLKFGWLNFTATARIYLKIILAYTIVKVIGQDFLKVLESIIYKLSLISLPLFALQLIIPDTFTELNGFLEFMIPPVDKGGARYTNSIIFSVNPWGMGRNSGFMWEPGGFAAILAIGLYLNLVFNSFRLNKRFFVMSIAMITTVSTAGYILYMVIIAFYLFNTRVRYFIIATPLAIICGYFLFNSEFVKEKIEDRFQNRNKTINNLETYSKERDAISLGRFGSLIVDINDFTSHPVIGFGLQADERTNNRYIDMVRVNGFSDYLVKFGLTGVILMIISLGKTESALKRVYGFRGSYVFAGIVLILSFSNPLLITPLFFSFQLMGWVHAKKIKPVQKSMVSYG